MRDDDRAVTRLELRLERARREVVLGQVGDVGVAVGDLGTALPQEADDLERRRLAQVADPGLYDTPMISTFEPRTAFACSFSAPAIFSTQKYGIAWFTSPASSMNSVGMSNSRARQVR